MSVLKERTQHFESLIRKAQNIHNQLEKQLKDHVLIRDSKQKMSWLEIVKEKPVSQKSEDQKVIQFGQSPFKNLDSSP